MAGTHVQFSDFNTPGATSTLRDSDSASEVSPAAASRRLALARSLMSMIDPPNAARLAKARRFTTSGHISAMLGAWPVVTQAPCTPALAHASSLDTDLTRNTRASHFTPQHWLLCHMGLYYFEFEFGRYILYSLRPAVASDAYVPRPTALGHRKLPVRQTSACTTGAKYV